MGNLSDSKIRALQYGIGPKKVYDGDALFVRLTKTKSGTGKYFKYDYVVGGRRKQIGFGKFPDIGLAKARELHRNAREHVALGIDPLSVRNKEQQAQIAGQRTLDMAAGEFFEVKSSEWSDSHSKKEVMRWNKHVSPYLGKTLIAEVTRAAIKARLQEIEKGSIDTARRALSLIDQVFNFDDFEPPPSSGLGRNLKKHRQKTRPAIVFDPIRLGTVLNRIDALPNMSRAALQLIAVTFVRHGTLRSVEWSDIDFDSGLWTVPPHKLKVSGNGNLIIPLSAQALVALRALQDITGGHRYVLTTGIPRRGGEVAPLSDGTLNKALATCVPRSEHKPNSFRRTAYTTLREHGHELDDIKLQMHHVKTGVRSHYDDSIRVTERGVMLQWYANYLDECRQLAKESARDTTGE